MKFVRHFQKIKFVSSFARLALVAGLLATSCSKVKTELVNGLDDVVNGSHVFAEGNAEFENVGAAPLKFTASANGSIDCKPESDEKSAVLAAGDKTILHVEIWCRASQRVNWTVERDGDFHLATSYAGPEAEFSNFHVGDHVIIGSDRHGLRINVEIVAAIPSARQFAFSQPLVNRVNVAWIAKDTSDPYRTRWKFEAALSQTYTEDLVIGYDPLAKKLASIDDPTASDRSPLTQSSKISVEGGLERGGALTTVVCDETGCSQN